MHKRARTTCGLLPDEGGGGCSSEISTVDWKTVAESIRLGTIDDLRATELLTARELKARHLTQLTIVHGKCEAIQGLCPCNLSILGGLSCHSFKPPVYLILVHESSNTIRLWILLFQFGHLGVFFQKDKNPALCIKNYQLTVRARKTGTVKTRFDTVISYSQFQLQLAALSIRTRTTLI